MTPTPRTITEYDRAAPDEDATRTATFGLGCFWGPDARFGAIDGVVRTRVGYAGGTTAAPTYHDLGDHTEVVRLEYDPERLGYADLLGVAFDAHDPDRQPGKRQYHGLVCPETDAQREALSAYLRRIGRSPEGIETRIEPRPSFHAAESYHQKYTLRTDRTLMGLFEEAGYDDRGIRESAAAAKLNADLAGKDVGTTLELGIGTVPYREDVSE